MKKIISLLVFIFVSVTSNVSMASTSYNYTPPATSGVIWVVIDPVLNGDLYVADFTVTWGSYQKRFSGGYFQKRGPGYFVIGFSHFDNNSYNFNASINQTFFSTYLGNVVQIYQGAQPNYPGQTLLYCGSTIQC